MSIDPIGDQVHPLDNTTDNNDDDDKYDETDDKNKIEEEIKEEIKDITTGHTGTTEKNIYVLVHGSWHGAWCWYKLKPLLERAGHTVIAEDNIAHGSDSSPLDQCT